MKVKRMTYPPKKVFDQVVFNITGSSNRFRGTMEVKDYKVPIYVIIKATMVTVRAEAPLTETAIDALAGVLKEIEGLLRSVCGKPYELTFEVFGGAQVTPTESTSEIADRFWKELVGE